MVEEVLEFWFGAEPVTGSSYADRRRLWFGKNPEFDRTIRTRFQPLYQQAVQGELESWRSEPLGCLALVLVLDQFSRNMFRDTPQAFAADEQAREVAKAAIDQGFDRALPPVQRIFLYLPLEHSENGADQQRSVQLMQELAQLDLALDDVYDYALRHQAVIDRFGRFPHRNQSLGRPSTEAELEFLKQPGSSF